MMSFKMRAAILLGHIVVTTLLLGQARKPPVAKDGPALLGFRDPAAELALEAKFLAVPDPKLAEEYLRTLTASPHVAGSPEDRKTAEYVAGKFREAGLSTEIVEYRVWMNYPAEVSVDVVAPAGVKMHGPARERISAPEPYQNDPRIIAPFSGYSPSGDVEAVVVYANYGRPEDFKKLEQMKIDVRGKIVIVRYGENFRGVKSYLAQQRGAAGVLIYSDPMDDGWFKGDKYPAGPWRPDTGVQRGSILYIFEYPGDPTTPGVASLPSLPDSQRLLPQQAKALPTIPTTALSYADARPILENLGAPDSPRDWQGALPFTYHLGPGPVKVRIHLKQNYAYRTIWDVIGSVRGSQFPDEMVIAGNHRDAWVYGAVDPNSGTAAMLESVRGLGKLLQSGWRPKRTIVVGSWDGEEQGLIGSTEWAEQHEHDLERAAAYFNMDVGVSGHDFTAQAVPSLKQFIRDISKSVPSPSGGTVYQAWMAREQELAKEPRENVTGSERRPVVRLNEDAPVGDLGSGSDYTPFLQHVGVPSSDISSRGPYGVYHSAFDDFAWFKKFADPDFGYEQEMARIFGLEILRMAEADVLPYDYESYGKEISAYLAAAQKKAETVFGRKAPSFEAAEAASRHFSAAGAERAQAAKNPTANASDLNRLLMEVERALLLPDGLPHRPWYRHAIYAPGEYTGYAAVVIPGVTEALDEGDLGRATEELAALTAALTRATRILESHPPAAP